MKKFAALFTLTLGLFNVNAQANQSPVSISITDGPNQYTGYVRVTSHSDNLVINDVIVNRGSCQVASSGSTSHTVSPTRLSFGQSANFRYYPTRCNIIEVTVVTNQGNWTVR